MRRRVQFSGENNGTNPKKLSIYRDNEVGVDSKEKEKEQIPRLPQQLLLVCTAAEEVVMYEFAGGHTVVLAQKLRLVFMHIF